MLSLGTPGEQQVRRIGDVTTEAGGVIRDVHIAFRFWGIPRVTATDSNVILVNHALTGDANAVDWWAGLIGPGLAIDTDVYCVICTNALGGCQGSTGPSSPHPDGRFWGSRFPAISIRDIVATDHKLLTSLGIDRLAAVIGGSMGGARTLEWALMYPEMTTAALVLAVSARASAWQIGIQCAQIASIEKDPDWLGGDFYSTGVSPDAGMATARKLAHLTYRGELEIDERFGTDPQEGEQPLGVFRSADERFAVESYLDYQAQKLLARFDAGSYVALTEALNRHDVGRGRGGLNKALASMSVPTFIVGVDTDILYPYHQQEHLSRNVGNLLGMAKITSPVGHDAFLTETRQLDQIMRRFFRLLRAQGDRPLAAEGVDRHS
ncbi:homoserine O-acetyltransferase MetX [Corynebacterium epidermidicanis]|uniref:Homoserine O-acetyltransferase n=1 Tax=Corynebacterium epidermidicanis TaxID=1050174 RepID=A0A0G3GU79_9CORY|nr:homoserine O-acetyltransferase [Corynebacterium epidermidicanis]AKK02417.1 homoserine O-acetyltransferase [Corynebacterium epidermidicanis]